MALGSLFIYSLLFFATVYLIEYERKRSREKLLLLKYGILNPLSLTGVQFEKACGDVLSARGYMVEYTKASGDYGIDVIARKNGLAVGIQCKRHTAKVGVKAVQEVHSGTMYYGLDRSCVISIAGFTKNSMTLASKLNVDRRDPAWLMVETAVVSISAAAEAGAAARLVHADVTKIPDLIHHAVISGGADISGQVQSAVVQTAEQLARAIQGGIEKATVPAVQAVGKALKDFDSKVDKTIIARKDAVVAQWVQSGSAALDSRVREAIRTERSINVAFMMFAILSALILGIFLGMHLHF